MPNHVSNKLTVDGATKDVDRFLKHMGDGFDFEKVIPMPDNIYRDNVSSEDKERLAKEGIPNWYDWCVENWDTKWNAYDVKRDVGTYGEVRGKYVTYDFLTAWSPPIPVIEKLRKDWPDLDIYGGYIGEGYEFCDQF
jgi:hypothetical protein|tara:strand:- start:884 stop:1294 length:411 start_codon:yes stop_codon:yes gene_type:complete